ncbi:MAG: tetratricopeptide repeat protein [Bacteroidetes bacterium]|nr:tetratricopeptide repeat protein [Bacteroidota bacterium]
MRQLLLSFFLLATTLLHANKEAFVFTPKIVEAYHEIMALRLEKGNDLLKEEAKKNAKSPALAFVSEYYYFLKSFINEDVQEFDKEIEAFNKRLSIIRQGDQESPYYLYCQAELLLHQAAMRFKFRDYLRGANNVRDAYKLLEKNIQLYPKFSPQYKSMGMLQVLVGTVPDNYLWITDLLGMKGNIHDGMKKIESFRNAPFVNPETEMLKEEALFMYAFLQLHIVKEKEEAWQVVEASTRNYSNNLLQCYVRAAIGLQCKKTDEVIRTLNQRPKDKEYARFYFLEYMLGKAYLFKQDSSAQIHFKTFVSFFKGKNYIKDAYRKLGWSYLCMGDEDKYHIYMGLVERYGQADIDEDKQALLEAEKKDIPQPEILRGRMYFDGGYYKEALNILKSLENRKWDREQDAIEYPYRLARVYDESNQTDLAISYYKKTIAIGANAIWYFAANSSLHLGLIYEKEGKYDLAKQYFNKAMNFPNQEYTFGINQQAKSGLERLKEK